MRRKKAFSDDDSFDQAFEIPGEVAPILENPSLSLFKKNKVNKYTLKKKSTQFEFSPTSARSKSSLLSEKRREEQIQQIMEIERKEK